jgi:acyl-CoA synthetase
MQQLLTLHNPQLAREYYLAGTWRNDTMYGLVREHARARGHAFALRDAKVRLTWQQLQDWVDSVAAHLHQAGLRGGDRVAVWLPNRVEAVVVLLACSRNGYVCNPSLHQNYTVAEITTLLERISCRALFAQPGYGADAKDVNVFERAAAVATMKQVFALPAEPGVRPEVREALAFPPMKTTLVPPSRDSNADKVVYLAFTSGTTGMPKGVMHSDNTLLANGRAMVQDWGHDAETVLLTLSPMSHHIGTVALEQTLVTGCELVIKDPSSRMGLLDWIEETSATYVMGVPTHAMDVLAAMRSAGKKQLGKVKVFYMAGSPIPQETAEQFLAIGVTPQNVYGMTENGSHQYTRPSDTSTTITGTCGKACNGFEVRLWDPECPDQEAVPGQVGEIGSRGALLMLGYFANQSATEGSFNAGGWFLSGDLGQFDDEGNLRIVGRKKDLIIRGGHNIHPAHIEGLAHRHKGVAMAAAFAVPDERLGEKVCLAIIPAGEGVGAEQMLEHLAEQGLSKFDMPEYFLCTDSFPMTPSGKILKRELIEWVRLEHVKPIPVRWTPKKVSP